jgi:cytochrome c biogenesis protein
MGTATRWLHNLWRAAGSIRLAAILLAAVLLTSCLASLFPQMPANPAVHERWLAAVALRYGRATSLLRALGLFNLHRAPWFVGLLAALVLNTLACTLQRLPRLWRALCRPPLVVRPDAFYLGFAHRAEWPVSSLPDGLTMAQSVLAQRRYRVRIEHQGGSAYLYAERGRWGRVGTVVSHVTAILLTLAVVTRPALAWQDADITLLPGQVHQVGHERDLAVRAGSLTIDRGPGEEPRDYRVPLTVLVHDSPTMTRTVRINHPLTFQGVAFHLQGYGSAAQVTTPERTSGLAFVGGQTQEVDLPEAGLTLRVAYQPMEEALFVEALDADGDLLGSGIVAHGQEIEVQGTPITFTLSLYTVWQVSRDPTFGLAMGAAALLLAAVLVSFCVPHRRLWLRMDPQQAQMVGAGDFDGAFDVLANELSRTSSLSRPDSVRSGSGDPDQNRGFDNPPGAILDLPSPGEEEGGTSG